MPGSVSVTASLHGPSTHGAVMETAMVEIEQVNLWYGPKQALKNVTKVGNDPKPDPGMGTCGKDGQSVPVGVGLPTLRIDHMTVGGTKV